MVAGLDMNGNKFTCGSVVLGIKSAANRNGLLILGTGSHSIASIADGNASNLVNAIDLGTSTTTLSGTFDGDNITVTNDNARIIGGTLTNVDCSLTNTLDATNGVIDGGNTFNVIYSRQANRVMRLDWDSTRPNRVGRIPQRRR